MAIRWFYSTIQPTGGSSRSRSIVSRSNKMITQPLEYNGVIYGTKYNPIYSVGMSSGIISDTRWNYYIDDSTNIGGTYETAHVSAKYTGFVGIIEGDVSITGTSDENSYIEDPGGNKPISGRWRTKDVWQMGAHGPYFLIPMVHSLTLKDGTVYTSNEIGSKTYNTYPYLNIGGIDIGYNSGRDYTVADNYKDMVIDFGDIPQDCPAIFYDYIASCFNYIYPNSYTIKSPNGETLASIDEQPPIIETNLLQAGSSYQLILTLSDGTIQTLTWSYDTPEGYQFIGLGTSAFTGVTIPLGFNTTSIGESITLYPIFAPYRPQPDTFDINLYQNKAEYNRLDKTDYLRSVGTISGVFRESVSITDLTIVIESNTFPNFNYVYIDKFKRYYFVNDIRIIANNLFEIDLSVDPLMSYKDALLEMSAFVDRNENTQNPYLIDKKRVIEQGVDITQYFIPNTVPTEIHDYSINDDIRYVLSGYKINIKYKDNV